MRSVFVIAGCVLALAISTGVGAEILQGEVVQVNDGDTLKVRSWEGTILTVRLSGIDAPERAQPHGNQAAEMLKRLVGRQKVLVDWHKQDRFGRLIGKVSPSDRAEDLGLTMLKAGMAWHFKAFETEQSETDKALYSSAETSARKERRGLWQDQAPTAPWDFRKRKREGKSRKGGESS